MKQAPNLDLMRAFAVLLVVAGHSLIAVHRLQVGRWEIGWLAEFGVYLFFVHTALVLMWSLERRPHTVDFYIRRVFRLFPLAWVAILIALLTHAPLTGTLTNFFQYQRPDLRSLVANFLLLLDLIPRTDPVTGVLWTLPFEMHMYLLLPLLFFFIQKNRSLWPLLLFWLMVIGYKHNGYRGGMDLVFTMGFFLPGVIAYVGYKKFDPTLPAWSFALCLATLLVGFMLHPSHEIGWLFILPLGLLLPFFRQTRSQVFTGVGHQVAKYSYGIYLFHPFALVLGIYLLPHQPRAVQFAVVAASLATFSVAGYHLVEKPMIDMGARLAARVERRYERIGQTA